MVKLQISNLTLMFSRTVDMNYEKTFLKRVIWCQNFLIHATSLEMLQFQTSNLAHSIKLWLSKNHLVETCISHQCLLVPHVTTAYQGEGSWWWWLGVCWMFSWKLLQPVWFS